MKTEFSKSYIQDNRGCYEEEQVTNLTFINQDVITLEDMYNELPIKDFTWFLFRKCEFTNMEMQKFSTHIARLVLPIYEREYPNDNRVRNCIEITERYNDGNATLDELKEARAAASATDAADAAAYAAAYAAYASAAYASAADAYVSSAAAANDAAYVSAYAAAAAAYDAAAYADAAAYRKSIWNYIENNLIN